MSSKTSSKNKENRSLPTATTTSKSKPVLDQSDDELDLTSTNTTTSSRTTKRKPASTKSTSISAPTRISTKKSEVESASEDEIIIQETQEDSVMTGEDKKDKIGKKKTRSTASGGGKKGVGAGAQQKKKKKQELEVDQEEIVVDDDDDEEEDEEAVGEDWTPREKRMKERLELTETALKQVQTAFEQLRELRITRAEESEKTLTDLAAERQAASLQMIQNYKTENTQQANLISQLQQQLSSQSHTSPSTLLSTTSKSPSPSKKPLPNSPRWVSNTGVSEREELLEKELKEMRESRVKEQQGWEEKVKERDELWKKELEKKDDEKKNEIEEVRKELQTLTTELAAEVSHSKSLQSKLKSLSSTPLAPLPSSLPPSTSNPQLLKLQSSLSDLQTRLMLNEDLTGLAVHSVTIQPGEELPTYNCVLTDCLGKAGSLGFKVAFRADGTCCFWPDVDPERDPILFELLPEQFRQFMRFKAEDCGKWFRTLFRALNRITD